MSDLRSFGIISYLFILQSHESSLLFVKLFVASHDGWVIGGLHRVFVQQLFHFLSLLWSPLGPTTVAVGSPRTCL